MSEQVRNSYDQSAIQVLEGLEPVRKRPGMYIGTTDVKGLHHLITEVVDNSIDEALAGYCTEILVRIEKDGSCTVVDNGRGIPTGIIEKEGKSAVEVVLTKLHAGGKFGGGGYKISGGLHGVGVPCVNALSEKFYIEVYQNGNIYAQTYHRGVPDAPLTVIGQTDKTGTSVRFWPDPEIFDSIVFNYDTMKGRLRELAYLNKGLIINASDQREGQEREEKFHYEGGIKQFVEQLNKGKNVLADVIYIEEILENKEVELALQFNEGYNETIFTYANNINTEEGGAHLEGLKTALTRVFNNAGYDLKVLKDKDKDKLSGEDVREGLTAVISVKLSDPQFEGQTKTKLGNADMRTLVNKIVGEKLGELFEENPGLARTLVTKAYNAQQVREKLRKVKEQTRKDIFGGGGMPEKLADCVDTDPRNCEIFIVEGDSAGGSAKTGRMREFQAILPLRGKILNVEKAREHQILDNKEIQAMIKAFGCGYKEDFDITKLRYDRIICMTDADVDGSHIRILLLTFFFRFMPELIAQGHVYSALPPLYKLSRGKEVRYCYDDAELKVAMAEMSENGTKKVDQQRYKGLGEMNADQLFETTMNPETRTLVRITMEDAVEADAIFTMLMGDAPELRREFIETHARSIEDLDV